MAALKDKLINLGGLDYFNKNIVKPTYSTIPVMAEALALMQQWVTETETRIDTLENTSSGSFASMFEIALPDEIHISSDGDAVSTIESALNLDGFSQAIGTSGIRWKKPTIVLPEIEWSHTVDDNYDHIATANVRIVFGEAGAVVKTVTLKKPGEGKLYAVKPSGGAYIDTGIKGNYAYTYHTKGHTQGGNQCVLVDAFVSTSERATTRILGNSNKLQHMWYANKEVIGSAAGMDFNKMFEMTVGANYMVLSQDGLTYNASISGQTTTGTINSNIRLLGSAASGFNNGVMCFAEILDGNGETLAYFAPYELHTGEIVIVNTAGITTQQILGIVRNGDSAEMASRILRPTNGDLVDAT